MSFCRMVRTRQGMTIEFALARAPGRFEPMLDGATGKPAIIRNEREMRAAINATSLKSGGSNGGYRHA